MDRKMEFPFCMLPRKRLLGALNNADVALKGPKTDRWVKDVALK